MGGAGLTDGVTTDRRIHRWNTVHGGNPILHRGVRTRLARRWNRLARGLGWLAAGLDCVAADAQQGARRQPLIDRALARHVKEGLQLVDVLQRAERLIAVGHLALRINQPLDDGLLQLTQGGVRALLAARVADDPFFGNAGDGRRRMHAELMSAVRAFDTRAASRDERIVKLVFGRATGAADFHLGLYWVFGLRS
jgi:hypothetical protein